MPRWWTYQAERFPLAAHLPLIAAFAASAIAFSAILTGQPWSWAAFGLAFPVCVGFFLQLRIADEFKDFAEDSRWRPYRPVPRGLVSLRELGWVFAAVAAIQLGLTLWLQPGLLWLLAVGWAYLAAMSAEFGARRWLKARPLWYLFSHMGIMPLVDLFATATLWQRALPAGQHPPLLPLGLFLAASFCNGLVIELGRKLRAPADEEPGVETYSALWGTRRAPLAWLAAVGLTVAFALASAALTGILLPAAVILPVLLILAAILASQFRRQPLRGQRFEHFSGLWTLAFYLCLGPAPLLASIFLKGT